MEEYLKLNWSWKTARCDQQNLEYFDANFSEDEDIFYGHLNELNYEFLTSTHNSNASKQENVCKDPRNGKIVDKYFRSVSDIFRKPTLFKHFPFKSDLKEEEHKYCLGALLHLTQVRDSQGKIKINHDTPEMQTYLALTDKIKKENEKFESYVKGYFMSNLLSRKKDINPVLETLFIEQWKTKVHAFLQNEVDVTNTTYILATAVPIRAQTEDNAISVTYVKKLCTHEKPEMSILSYKRAYDRIEVRRAIHELKEYYKNLNEDHATRNNYLNKLMNEEIDVDVWITTDAIVHIFSSFYDSSSEWLLPIDIMENEHFQTGQTIWIHDPTPPTKQNSVDRQVSISKDLLQAIYVKHHCRSDQNKSSVSDICHSAKTQTENKQFKPLLFEDYLQQFFSKHGKERKLLINKCLVSNLFEMKENDKQESLKIGVHHSPHAIADDNLIQFCPKLEYQYEFGAEQMTKTELIKEWVTLKFCPDIIVKRIRLQCSTMSIISIRDVCLETVKYDLFRLYNIKEDTLLNSFRQFLTILQKFPSAKYLAKYDPTKKNSVSIYKESDTYNNEINAKLINLVNIFSNLSYDRSNLEEFDWTPIDSLEVTDIHTKANVMPGMFPYYGKNLKQIVEFRKLPKKPKCQSKTKRKKCRSKKRMLKRKQLKAVKETETFDPKDLFDASGNVNIMSFIRERTPVESMLEKTLNDIDIQVYKREAQGGSLEVSPSSKKKKL